MVRIPLASPGTLMAAQRHAQVLPGTTTRAATVVSNAQVGDADSFGREQVYLGVGQSIPVTLAGDCTGSDQPDAQFSAAARTAIAEPARCACIAWQRAEAAL